jgi:hypothetical protein
LNPNNRRPWPPVNNNLSINLLPLYFVAGHQDPPELPLRKRINIFLPGYHGKTH